MDNVILHAHSGLRWVALLFLVLAIFKAFSSKNNPYQPIEKKLGLFTLISFHTQALIGLYLYFTSAKVSFIEGFMSEKSTRFFNIEHLVGMVLAIIFVTMAYSMSKKKESALAKRKPIKIWFTIALIIVLASIPWPFREGLGGQWF